jgi:hypothetical protein
LQTKDQTRSSVLETLLIWNPCPPTTEAREALRDADTKEILKLLNGQCPCYAIRLNKASLLLPIVLSKFSSMEITKNVSYDVLKMKVSLMAQFRSTTWGMLNLDGNATHTCPCILLEGSTLATIFPLASLAVLSPLLAHSLQRNILLPSWATYRSVTSPTTILRTGSRLPESLSELFTSTTNLT